MTDETIKQLTTSDEEIGSKLGEKGSTPDYNQANYYKRLDRELDSFSSGLREMQTKIPNIEANLDKIDTLIENKVSKEIESKRLATKEELNERPNLSSIKNTITSELDPYLKKEDFTKNVNDALLHKKYVERDWWGFKIIGILIAAIVALLIFITKSWILDDIKTLKEFKGETEKQLIKCSEPTKPPVSKPNQKQ